MYQLEKKEKKLYDNIIKTEYMKETIKLIDKYLAEQTSVDTYKNVYDELYTILQAAKPSVDIYLAKRKANKEINDEKQALKIIAGSSFSYAIIYVFLKLKMNEIIRKNIFITSQKSQVPSFDKIATIMVDSESQKPDVDLVIYSTTEKKELKKCIILSLKTSLRERAGQTYKWKLLMEIATTNNQMKEKYNIKYDPPQMPIVCFATVNFYNEINNPQHRGMFKFFDNSFIGKQIDSEFISRLSELPNYVNNVL